MDSVAAMELCRQWQEHEAAIGEIKRRLATLLGVGVPESLVMPGAAPPAPARRSPAIKVGGPVAAGTKGRSIIEAIARLGGSGTRGSIAAEVPNGNDGDAHAKNIGSMLLSLKTKGYVESLAGGGWGLTAKARLALASDTPSNGVPMSP